MKDLIIIGASGFGREVCWLVERINFKKREWNFIGFFDDNNDINGKIGDYDVIGTNDEASDYMDAYFICAVGASKVRKEIIDRINKATNNKAKFATLVDPNVIMSEKVKIGEGTIICAGSVITTDIEIGNHSIINLNCTIGHDARLKDFVTLYPSVNVSGAVQLGECVEIGTGAQIIQGKSVGNDSIVGAGSVIVKDIPAKCTAVGVPAKPIKYYD